MPSNFSCLGCKFRIYRSGGSSLLFGRGLKRTTKKLIFIISPATLIVVVIPISDVSLISAWISPFPVLEIDAIEMKNNVDAVFRKLDLNGDGNVTREEFVESCLKVLIYHEIPHKSMHAQIIFTMGKKLLI